MPTIVEQIAINVRGDADDAVHAADAAGDAYTRMANQVEDAAHTADRATRDFSGVADSADDLAGKTGKATGALGALAGGLESVGLEKYAAGLQATAIATDVASGAGDILNLALESTIVKNIRARATTVAKTVAEKSAAVATKVMAAGQWALNAAMSANPIGLVVVAIAALVAGFILAYKKSATFRDIVQTAGNIGKEAIGWIVDRIGDVIDIAGKLIGWFRDKIPDAIDTFKTRAKQGIDLVLAPFRALQDIIQKILDLIGKIKLPDIHIPGLRAVAGGTSVATAGGGAAAALLGGDTFEFHFSGFFGDQDALVQRVVTEVGRINSRRGSR